MEIVMHQENDSSNNQQESVSTSWYTIKVYAGQEQYVASRIKDKASSANNVSSAEVDNNEEDSYDEESIVVIDDVIVPTKKTFSLRNGKEIVTNKTLWPGYVFIKTFFNEDVRSLVRSVRGVFDFVGGGIPVPISQHEISAIEDVKEEEENSVSGNFKEGDEVVIASGPLANTPAVFVGVNSANNKARVNISIFGRSNVVDLDWDQIESE